MKKVINFGKIDYNGSGRKVNTIEVEIELKEQNGKPVFSVSGAIWNSTHTDIHSAGQNLDKIKNYISDPLFLEVFVFWKKYHLNDLHAGCMHQDVLWTKEEKAKMIGKPCPVCGYKYGTSWVYQEIPESDLLRIKEIINMK